MNGVLKEQHMRAGLQSETLTKEKSRRGVKDGKNFINILMVRKLRKVLVFS